METTQEVSEESKRTVAVCNKKDELKLLELLKDKELLYNKTLMDYKDPNKMVVI